MRSLTRRLPAFLPILTLTALGCGGLGLPGGGPTTVPGEERRVAGEIERVDPDRRQITVDTGGERLTPGYDDRTRVVYRGEQYPPEALEPGDRVRMELFDDGGELYVAYVEVTESVQERRGEEPPDRFGERPITGEVEAVDPQRREVAVAAAQGRVVLLYDDRTRVLYEGREYRPENLEPGDLVRVEATENDRRELYAVEIEVEESLQDRRDRGALEGEIEGEVVWVDTERREIQLETDTGARLLVLYDADLSVLYRGRYYAAEGLESGDRVRVETRREGEELVATAVEVTESVQERRGEADPGGSGGAPGAVSTLSGTVEWLDERRGELGVRTDRLGVVTVEVPFNASRGDRDRFERLRRGDRVRLEAEELSRGRYELVRFL